MAKQRRLSPSGTTIIHLMAALLSSCLSTFFIWGVPHQTTILRRTGRWKIGEVELLMISQYSSSLIMACLILRLLYFWVLMPDKCKFFLRGIFRIFYPTFFIFLFYIPVRKILDLIIFHLFNLLFLDYLKQNFRELLPLYWWFFGFFLITLDIIINPSGIIIILFGWNILMIIWSYWSYTDYLTGYNFVTRLFTLAFHDFFYQRLDVLLKVYALALFHCQSIIMLYWTTSAAAVMSLVILRGFLLAVVFGLMFKYCLLQVDINFIILILFSLLSIVILLSFNINFLEDLVNW